MEAKLVVARIDVSIRAPGCGHWPGYEIVHRSALGVGILVGIRFGVGSVAGGEITTVMNESPVKRVVRIGANEREGVQRSQRRERNLEP